MSLAPISISTYSRLEHLTKTIESLQNNTLAKESVLYIFSDAPKEGDEEIVSKVRSYIHAVGGFKEVRVFEQTTNSIKKNLSDARTIPLKEFGKMIRMEDDNVVSPKFLQFINDGLDFYKDDERVLAISGFNAPAEFPSTYKYDYYMSTYFNAWGYGTWGKKGFLDIVNYSNQYNEMLKDKALYRKIKKVHPHLIQGLRLIQEGKLDAGDYKMVFHLIKNDLYTIKPIKSFVNNIGHDGSGVHCGTTDRFVNINLNSGSVNFLSGLEYNKDIDNIWRKFVDNKPPLFERVNRVFINIKKIISR